MFEIVNYSMDKKEAYKLLIQQAKSLVDSELPMISNLANISALLNQFLEEINWVGFYLMDQGQLVLGPFQGLPACTTISLERGVCGAAARNREVMRIADVHQFPGHIACDAASRSELVIPIHQKDLYGVLDIDSPNLGRFTEEDAYYLEQLVKEVIVPLFEGERPWL